jgi:hypothetical protein
MKKKTLNATTTTRKTAILIVKLMAIPGRNTTAPPMLVQTVKSHGRFRNGGFLIRTP